MARFTRTLAVGVVAALGIGTVGAVASPATAGDGYHGYYGYAGGGLALTRSAAATLDKFDVHVKYTQNPDNRTGHHGDGVTRLRGNIVFDGSGTDATWSRIRINDRTNRVTAIVNGGERRAVLRFKDAAVSNDRWSQGHRRTVLRLTRTGANSIDGAAAADAFDAGDAFARVAHRYC